MQPVLLDASIYTSVLRKKDDAILSLRRLLPDAPVWLSAVVLEELYAGAGARDRSVIEHLERDFERSARILVPSLTDWTQAGRVLARVAAVYGYERVGKARLTNDALIATSAARRGITVITANERDFARLAEFLPFLWEIRSTLS